MSFSSSSSVIDTLSAVWIVAAGLLFVAAPLAAALGIDRALELVLELQTTGRLVYLVGLAALISWTAVRAVGHRA